MTGLDTPLFEPEDDGLDVFERAAVQRQQKLDQQLLMAFESALGRNPEEVGEAKDLSRDLGYRATLPDVKQLRRAMHEREMHRRLMSGASPVLARQMLDPEFAAVAYDDIEELSWIEEILGKFQIRDRFRYEQLVALRGFLGDQPQTPAVKAQLDTIKKEMDRLPAKSDWSLGGIVSDAIAPLGLMQEVAGLAATKGMGAALAVGLAGQMGPQALAAEELITMPAAFTLVAVPEMITNTKRVEAGNAYLDMIEIGIDQSTARTLAEFVGWINASFEFAGGAAQVPIKALFGKQLGLAYLRRFITPGTRGRAWAGAGRRFLFGVAGETATEVAQEISNVIAEEIGINQTDPDKLDVEAIANRPEFWDRMADIAIRTVKGTLLLSAPGPLITLSQELKAVSDQQNLRSSLQDLTSALENSKTAKRSQSAIADFLRNASEGGSLEQVYVDADVMFEAMRDVGMTRDDLAKLSPRAAKLLDEASSGGVATIPLDDFGTKLLSSDLGKRLLNDLKVSPDGVSARQANKIIQQQRSDMLEQADKIIKEQAARDEKWVAEVKAIDATMTARFKATGKMSPTDAGFAARLYRAFVVVQSDRLGLTPREFHEQIGLDLWSEGAKTGPSLESVPQVFDAEKGLGAMPDNAEVNYRGYRVALAPDQFLRLAEQTELAADNVQGLQEQLQQGKKFGPPTLWLEWNEDDGMWDVVGHEGRHRSAAFQNEFPGQQLEAHLILRGVRPEQVTEEMRYAPIRGEDNRAVEAMPVTPESLQQEASTALPGKILKPEQAKKKFRTAPIGNPMEELILADFKTLMRSDKIASHAKEMRKLPFLRVPPRATDMQVIEAYIAHVVSNLELLFNLMPAELRERSRDWYIGGRRAVAEWSERYGMSPAQTAAIIAVLSPQREWFSNMGMVERVLDMLTGALDEVWTPEMTKAARLKVKRGTTMTYDVSPPKGFKISSMAGTTLRQHLEANNPIAAGYFIRIYDRVHNDRRTARWTPEGGAQIDEKTTTIQWTSYGTIAKVISLWRDGSHANIHLQLGEGHKVRSFYNNLFAPWSENNHVTMDTHAVAAGYLLPLGASHKFVTQVWGGQGGATDIVTGLKGFYPVMAEAYRRLGERYGLLPREVQSITWEMIRALLPPHTRKGDKWMKLIMPIWKRYRDGKIKLEEAQQQVLALRKPDELLWQDLPADHPFGPTYSGKSRGLAAAVGNIGRPPDAAMVMVEAKPNRSPELMAEWDQIPERDRPEATRDILRRVVSLVLRRAGVNGELVAQRGGWEGAVEASMSLLVDDPNKAVVVADMLGRLLHQEGMFVLSKDPGAGLTAGGAITVHLPAGADPALIDRIYQEALWPITNATGEQPFIGHSSTGRYMIIGWDAQAQARMPIEEAAARAADAIRALGLDLPVQSTDVYATLRTDKDYANAASATQPPAAGRPSAHAGNADLDAVVAAIYRSVAAQYAGRAEAARARYRAEAAAGAETGRWADDGGSLRQDQLGEFSPTVEQVEVGLVRLGTDTVTSPEELALAFNRRQGAGAAERLDIAVTDDAGRVLTVVGTSKGGVGHANLETPTMLLDAVKVPGAARLWISHNHPSGSAELSDADVKLMERLYELTRGSGLSVAGVMAIAGSAQQDRKWVFREPNDFGGTTYQGDTVGLEPKDVTVPVFDRMLTSDGPLDTRVVDNPRDAWEIAKLFAETSGDRTGLLLLDSQLRTVGYVPLAPKDAKKLRTGGPDSGLQQLFNALGSTTTATIVVVGRTASENMTPRGVGNVINALSDLYRGSTVRVVEAVDVSSDQFSVESTASSGEYGRKVAAVTAPGLAFEAAGPRKPRGRYFPHDRLIELGEDATLSTVLHEMGHYFMNTLFQLADQTKNVGMLADVQTLLDWFGVKDLDTWNSLSLDQQRKHHEAFAYNFELYMFTGRAPSPQMRTLFDKFRAWVLSAYRAVKEELNLIYRRRFGTDLPWLTAEVRSVMDRLLAASDAVATAEMKLHMLPVFQDKKTFLDAGFSDADWDRYQEALKEAHEMSVTDLSKASLRQMRWLQNARAKVLKMIQRDEAQTKKEAVAAARAELENETVYLIGQMLRDATAEEKLNLAEAKERLGDEVKAKLGVGKRGMLSSKGMSIDDAAVMFDFPSGDDLLLALVESPPLEEAAEARAVETLSREKDGFGDPKAIEEKVQRALHNEARARFIAVELRFLRKIETPVRATQQAAALAAREAIGRRQIKTLKPATFAAAESYAAREATKAVVEGRTEDAVLWKQRQLMNHALVQAAVDAREEVLLQAQKLRQKAFRPEKKLAKNYALELVMAARQILASYGLATLRQEERAVDYLQLVQRYDPVLYQNLEGELRAAEVRGRPFRELTVDEFRGMAKTVEALLWRARRDKQAVVEGKAQDLDALIENELLPNMPPPKALASERGQIGAIGRLLTMVREVGASLTRVEFLVRSLDGGKRGPWTRALWTGVRESVDRYRLDLATRLRPIVERLRTLKMPRGTLNAPEIGYVFGRETKNWKAELLGALAHTGNLSNKRRLVAAGDGVNRWGAINREGEVDFGAWDRMVQRLVDEGKITEEDFDFVQLMWDSMEGMKETLQTAHREITGRFFNEITAHPFTVTFPNGKTKTYAGGYVPAKADPDRVTNEDMPLEPDLAEMTSDFTRAMPQTANGFTKDRVAGVPLRPLQFDIRMVVGHMDEALRYAHVQPHVNSVVRILNDKRIDRALNAALPKVTAQVFKPWLENIAKQTLYRRGKYRLADAFWRMLRRNSGIAIMMANFVNVAQQPTGLANAAIYVSKRRLLHAAYNHARHPLDTAQFVVERSDSMNERLRNQVMELQSDLRELVSSATTTAWLQEAGVRYGYILQSVMQNRVDIVVWMAAYEEKVAAGLTEQEAIREADSIVRLSQGSFNPEDTASYEVGTPAWRAWTQFSNYFNTIFNQIKFADGEGLSPKVRATFYALTLPSIASAIIYKTLAGTWDDEDEDGVVDEVWEVVGGSQLRSAASTVPVAGGLAVGVFDTVFGNQRLGDRLSMNPSMATAARSVISTLRLVAAAFTEAEVKGYQVRDALNAITMATSIPASILGRPLAYVTDVVAGRVEPADELDFLRGLISGRASEGTR